MPLFLLPLISFTQDNSTPVSRVDYMKVTPGMVDDYLKLETIWKKIHQANIKAGKYEYWKVMEVISPSGADAPYDYITRQAFKSIEQLGDSYELPFVPEDLDKILSKEEMDFAMRANEFRTMVKTEFWAMDSQLREESDDGVPGKVNVFNFFDIPQGKTYANFQEMQELWIPVHKAKIKDNSMEGWVSLQMIMPTGAEQQYRAATVDIYKNMKEFLMTDFEPYFSKLGKNPENVFAKTEASSKMIRREVRQAVMDSNE